MYSSFNLLNSISAKKSGTLDSKTAQSVMERFEKEEMGMAHSYTNFNVYINVKCEHILI